MRSAFRPSFLRAFSFILVVFLLFLFSGCISRERAEAYAYAEDFFKRYVADTADTIGGDYDKDLARSWCTYARYPDDGDLGGHVLPDELYGYPINMGAHYNDDGQNHFAKNAQTLSELGDSGVQEIMDYAAAYWQRIRSVDYRTMDRESYQMAQLWFHSPYEKTVDYRRHWADEIYDYHIIMTSHFVTDPSAVYKAADGSYRVRGLGYLQYHTADDSDFIAIGTNMEVGKPYYCIMELSLIPYADDGRTPAWEHGPYHVAYFGRFTEWRASQDNMINKSLAMLPDA